MPWCPRCGGPLSDGVCANCSTAAGRKRQEQEVAARHRDNVRRWIETFTAIEGGEQPVVALLRSLLPEPESHADLLFRDPFQIVVAIPGAADRTIPLPDWASSELIRYAEAHFGLVREEDGHPIRLAPGPFRMEQIAGGFRICLAR
jgi:hypothetical protein